MRKKKEMTAVCFLFFSEKSQYQRYSLLNMMPTLEVLKRKEFLQNAACLR